MKKMTLGILLLVFCALGLLGCAAVKHRNLDVQAKMTDTIFLNPETLQDGKIYVRVTNTSDNQDIDFDQIIRAKIGRYGRTTTMNPKEATYIVQANLLYMGNESKDMTYEGALGGGFGGALTGVNLARHSSPLGMGTAGVVGGAIGAGVGAIAGSMVSIDRWIGVCDIQIKEMVEGGVTGTEAANMQQGSSATVNTTRNVKETRQEYRTRIGVRAVQTNIDKVEATNVISDRLGSQIAGYFK
jgi:uncharacterized membrane protein